MKLTAKLKVLSKEHKTGTTSAGRDWAMDEYLVVEDLVREDGSHNETHLLATTSQAAGELEIGGEYECTVFISSTEFNGKYYPKFRITYAVLLNAPEVIEEKQTEKIDDTLPF